MVLFLYIYVYYYYYYYYYCAVVGTPKRAHNSYNSNIDLFIIRYQNLQYTSTACIHIVHCIGTYMYNLAQVLSLYTIEIGMFSPIKRQLTCVCVCVMREFMFEKKRERNRGTGILIG